MSSRETKHPAMMQNFHDAARGASVAIPSAEVLFSREKLRKSSCRPVPR
jgi:hypothetical protein